MTFARPVPQGAKCGLRLLATTDLHMHLTDHDYFCDQTDPSKGLTRTATLIKSARAQAESLRSLTLLFDNGDAQQGTPLGELARDNADRAHPLMNAFAHLRYDAIGLGNHDFNFGLRSLETALRQAPCPVVCSNMHKCSATNPPGFSPFAILDRIVQSGGVEWPLRIGVLSFLPPQTVTWDAHLLQGHVQSEDILTCAKRLIPELQHSECDLIIALAHTGLSNTPEHTGMENAAIPLAAIPEIDAIIAGHTHLCLPGSDHAGMAHVDATAGLVHGTPMVMPGSAGSHLGIIDLELTGTPSGRWSVSAAHPELRAIAKRTQQGAIVPLVEKDAELAAVLATDHADTLTLLNQPVGYTKHPLHSYFTFIAPDRSLSVVAAAQTAALRAVLGGTQAAGLPLLSATSPGKFGARSGPGWFTDVPAGPIQLRHVADLHVFPNDLHAVVILGEHLIDWLEMSASLFHQIHPGSQGAALLNPDMPGHDFDVLHGLSYQIDLSRPARFTSDGALTADENRRITQVRLNNTPIRHDQKFAVALNSYRASGGGPFNALTNAQPVHVPPMTIRDALRDHLASGPLTDPLEQAPSPWSFAPMPGTRVTLQTGPGAEKYLPELASRGIKSTGIDAAGFLQLSVPL